MSTSSTVNTGGMQVQAPTFIRDYTFKTLQPYFDPYEVVLVHAQGSDNTKVLTSSYGECESPDGSDMSFLIPVWTSVVYDEYGELVPGGPPPNTPLKATNTSPSNSLILGQYAPDPYKLAIPQTGMFAGAGSSYEDYGNFAAHGKQAPGGASKSVIKPRGAVHVGDGLDYDPAFGNMGGAIANGKPVTDPNAVDATNNPTPKLGAPIKLHLGKDAKAHGLEFWEDKDEKATKAVGVKLAASSPGLEFDASDGGLKVLGAASGQGFLAKEGKNIDFTPQVPVDAPVLSDPTSGGTSTTGGRDIAYVWIIPDDVGPGTSDSAISPTAYAVTTDTNNQINGNVPISSIKTKATGLILLARKTSDPNGPFYEVATISTYDPTEELTFSLSADDTQLTTEHAAPIPAINVTDTVALVGLVPDAKHSHTAMGTLGLGTWASKEENPDWQYHGGNTGAHLFFALDGAEPADLLIAYSRNATGDYTVNDQWNVTADWSEAGPDGHHPLISSRMNGLGEFDTGVKTGVVQDSPKDDDLHYPEHWGTLPDGWVMVKQSDNTLWWRSSGDWHSTSSTASSAYTAGPGIAIASRVVSVKLCPCSGLTLAGGCLAANPDKTTIVINSGCYLQAIGVSSSPTSAPPASQPPTKPPGTSPPVVGVGPVPVTPPITPPIGSSPLATSSPQSGYNCFSSDQSTPLATSYVAPAPVIQPGAHPRIEGGPWPGGNSGYWIQAKVALDPALFADGAHNEFWAGLGTSFFPQFADDVQGFIAGGGQWVTTGSGSGGAGGSPTPIQPGPTAYVAVCTGACAGETSGNLSYFLGSTPYEFYECKSAGFHDFISLNVTVNWSTTTGATQGGTLTEGLAATGIPAGVTIHWLDGTTTIGTGAPNSTVPTSPTDYTVFWREGWNAYVAGTPETSCPYTSDPDANKCAYWTQGWIDARNALTNGNQPGGSYPPVTAPYTAPTAPAVVPTPEKTVWTEGYNQYILGTAPPYNPYIHPNTSTPDLTHAMYWNQGWIDARNAFVGQAGYLMPGGSGGNGAGGVFY